MAKNWARAIIISVNASPQQYQVAQAKAAMQQAQANLKDLLKGERASKIAALLAQQQSAQANLTYQQKNLQRQIALHKKGYISVNTLNATEQQYQSALASVKEAKANLVTAHLQARANQRLAAKPAYTPAKSQYQQSDWQLKQKTQTAPFTGLVNDTYFTKGETVPQDAAVISLIAPNNMYAIFYVNAKTRAKLSLGETLTITANQTQQTQTATLNYISPQAMYTPPLIYSEKNMDDLVFEVHAKLNHSNIQLWPGQPIVVRWNQPKS